MPLPIAAPASTVFQTWEWFDAWWSSFGAGHRLYFLSVHDGEDVIGFAPLMMIRGRLGLRQLEFVGSPNADYQDFVIPDRRCRGNVRHLPLPARGAPELGHARAAEPARGIADAHGTDVRVRATWSRQHGYRTHHLPVTPHRRSRIRGQRDLLGRYSVTRKVRQLEHRGQVEFRVLDVRRGNTTITCRASSSSTCSGGKRHMCRVSSTMPGTASGSRAWPIPWARRVGCTFP